MKVYLGTGFNLIDEYEIKNKSSSKNVIAKIYYNLLITERKKFVISHVLYGS